jgi:hypothetical protein
MNIPTWLWVPDHLEIWAIMAFFQLVLLLHLVGWLRTEIRSRRLYARAVALPPIQPGINEAILPFTYTRREWIRDMEDPDLTIEEISVRVVRSNGAWRRPPAPPPDPSPPSPAYCAGTLGAGLGSLAALAGILATPLLGSVFADRKK